jgi:hypothetical protein
MSYIEGPGSYAAGGMSGRRRGISTIEPVPHGWIDLHQAMARWGGSETRYRNAIKRGEITGKTLGGRVILRERSASAWIKEHDGKPRTYRERVRPAAAGGRSLWLGDVPAESRPVPEGWEVLDHAGSARGYERHWANRHRLAGRLECKAWRLPGGHPAWIAPTADLDKLPAPRPAPAPSAPVVLTRAELKRRCAEVRCDREIPPPPEVGWDYESPDQERRYREHIRRELKRREREGRKAS